ncbi:MAG: translation initiation factor IF-2 [Bacillota bacterium]
MVKKRVHELAKELDIESKEVIKRLAALGVAVKTHMSAVEEQDVRRLLAELKKEKTKETKTTGAASRVSSPAATQAPSPAAPAAPAASPGPAAPAAKPPEQPVKPEKKGAEPPAKKISEKRPAPPEITRPKEPGPGKGADRGPGLVDRVPSRPPDRRFLERPFTKGDFFPGVLAKAPGAAPEARPKPVEPRPVEQRPAEQKAAGPRRPEPRQAEPGPAAAPKRERGREQRGREHFQKAEPAYKKQAPHGRPPAGRGQVAREPVPGKKGLPEKEQRAEQLKVPRVPEEIRPQEKAKRDKGRYERTREDWRDVEDRQVERKLRFIPGGKRKKEEIRRRELPPAVEKKPIVIGETITVQELAGKMKKSPAEVIKKLMLLGVLATINQEVDHETATIVAGEFGYEVQVKFALDEEALLNQEPAEDPARLRPRPCVVTVMGHVDHGKTSLLDAIRETNVTATEVGGITQHIGAYQVEHNNKKITFIDTPGHEAFTAMRARGASVTDIAVLVVAADDGVMPQTVEAINHAKAANTPIIVAINKIDKAEADVDRVKRQLTEYELVPEEWGGQTICVPVSAKTRQGLGDLLEMILLVAEISDLKANPDRPARGTIIEAELDKGRGPVATVLVQNGTLRVGDNVLAGTAAGRVRAMTDHLGRRVKSVGPSTPVEVLGFSDVPQAGDILYVVADEKLARQIAAKRILRKREEEIKAAAPKVSLDDLFKQIKEGQVKELNIILKADVQGSVEALRKALEGLSTDEVRVNIIHSGVGLISETDILLASASNAIVLGFNVKPDINARRAAEAEKVDIRIYRVIYDALNDVKAAMSGLLEPEYREVVIGQAEVRKIFKISKIGTIAGCYVKEGKLTRDARVKLLRDGTVVYEGKLDSLKRFKDDVREVQEGYECGLALENFNDIQEGDVIEALTTETIKRELA